jgi:hypothetical protein
MQEKKKKKKKKQLQNWSSGNKRRRKQRRRRAGRKGQDARTHQTKGARLPATDTYKSGNCRSCTW